MHHPNSVMETKTRDHGYKDRSCSNQERKKIAERNLSIVGKSEEMREHFFSKGLFVKCLDVIFNLIFILIYAIKEIILGIINWMVLCPIALASSCRNCPAFKLCTAKKIVGDFKG